MAGALVGYRVLDLAGQAGSFGSRLLAALGADVIKVEPPGGDPTRRLPPLYRDESGRLQSVWFAYMNARKRSITLDLEQHRGRELFAGLARSADVVYVGGPPADLARRGIDEAAIRDLNAQAIWVSVTPFGSSGPRRNWRASDLVCWAVSGVLQATGDPDRAPVAPGGPAELAYALGSINAAIGTLLALRARRRDGRARSVDVSVQESAVMITAEAGVPTFLEDLAGPSRQGNRRRGIRPFGLYPCKDGWVSIVAVMPTHWDGLAALITARTGNATASEELFRDPMARLEGLEAIDLWTEELTRSCTKQELFEEGQRQGFPVAPVNSLDDLLADPHLERSGFWSPVEDPRLGRLVFPGPPYRLSATPAKTGPPPAPGADNVQLYEQELGVGRRELEALVTAGVI